MPPGKNEPAEVEQFIATVQPAAGTDEEKILGWVREKGSIKRAECQQLLGVSPVQARHKLQQLRKAGRLKLQGQRKGARYVLA